MSQENVEVVRRVLRAFNEKNVATIRELWAPDGEWRPAFTGGGLVEGAVYRGRDEVASFIEAQAETWESIDVRLDEISESGDRVLVKIRLRAVGRASGVELDRTTWNAFELRDGLVQRGVVYETEEARSEALGLES